jgi:hypothetical protein
LTPKRHWVELDDVRLGDYAEVACDRHEWTCGHRHRKWGPWARCATRHQEEAE